MKNEPNIPQDVIDQEAKALSEKIASLRGTVSRKKFAEENGVPGGQNMIYQHIKGLRPISMEAAVGYARGFKCSISDLSPRLYNEFKELEAVLATDGPRKPTEDEFALVPQLDIAAACGEGRFNDHVVVKGGLAFKKSSLREFGVTEKTARVIFASGGSMAPTIQDGCVVLLNLADREPRDGKVYAINKPDGGLVLKRLVFEYRPEVNAQVWVMRSDNPDKNEHSDKLLPPDDRTMIIGRAIWNDNRL